MTRRSFLRSLGVVLLAPAVVVRAASAPPSLLSIHQRFMAKIIAASKEGRYLVMWSRQSGKTEWMRQMVTEHEMGLSSYMPIKCDPLGVIRPLRGFNAHCLSIDDHSFAS